MAEINHELLAALNGLKDIPKIREEYLNAPFGWPGAKFRSLDHILPLLPYRPRYGEPFGGSGKVLLARNSSPLEVFNDRCSGVTCFYRIIRSPETRDKLIDRLQQVPYSREEFIWSRDTWKECADEIERAARWFYTIRASFGSQGRNFGRSIDGYMMQRAYHNSLKLFNPVSHRLRYTLIENQDWRQILQDFDHPDMVWYLDPPYYKVTQGMYEFEFDDEEHRELLERIFHLKGYVAISSYPNPLYERYSWDDQQDWVVRTTTLAQAYTEGNNLIGYEDVLKRKLAKEVLYIKHESKA